MADLTTGPTPQTDSLLWYDVGGWRPYGLAIPGFGDDVSSLCDPIIRLADDIGVSLMMIMVSPCARNPEPPKVETLKTIHKLCIRCRDLLAAFSVPDNKVGITSIHAIPSPEVFRVYPVPYFTCPNRWLKTYARLALLALTELMQHTENARPLQFSTRFAGDIGQYIHQIYRSMAIEFFNVPVTTAEAPDFTIPDEAFNTYTPYAKITPTERINPVPDFRMFLTEDSIRPLRPGIPVTELPPNLGPWPGSGGASLSVTGATTPPAATGSSFVAPVV